MRLRTHNICFVLALSVFSAIYLSGCVVVELGVSNPVPNLPRIAIAPFINLSSERAVDGRRFAEAYQTELQKVPGFQVIPVGVVDSAIHDHQLNLDSPEDLAKLVDILDVDGICLGAVTEYTPYYPPRLGLQISWYTTRIPEFNPGIPIVPEEKHSRRRRSGIAGWGKSLRCKIPGLACAQRDPAVDTVSPIVRAQNEAPPFPVPTDLQPVDQEQWDQALQKAMKIEQEKPSPADSGPPVPTSGKGNGNDVPELAPMPELLEPTESPIESGASTPSTNQASPALPEMEVPPMEAPEMNAPQIDDNPQSFPKLPGRPQFPSTGIDFVPGESSLQPYMSYTRLFDGADAKFTAALRNYLELGGDQRSGGWTGHLLRSEDFIRFCMYRSIQEMLQLHGGLTKRRFVLTSRKYQ